VNATQMQHGGELFNENNNTLITDASQKRKKNLISFGIAIPQGDKKPVIRTLGINKYLHFTI